MNNCKSKGGEKIKTFGRLLRKSVGQDRIHREEVNFRIARKCKSENICLRFRKYPYRCWAIGSPLASSEESIIEV